MKYFNNKYLGFKIITKMKFLKIQIKYCIKINFNKTKISMFSNQCSDSKFYIKIKKKLVFQFKKLFNLIIKMLL